MEKIQYGMVGFFAGGFIGLLLAIVESKMIDADKHPAAIFIVAAITVLTCAIAGMAKGLSVFRKKFGRH